MWINLNWLTHAYFWPHFDTSLPRCMGPLDICWVHESSVLPGEKNGFHFHFHALGLRICRTALTLAAIKMHFFPQWRGEPNSVKVACKKKKGKQKSWGLIEMESPDVGNTARQKAEKMHFLRRVTKIERNWCWKYRRSLERRFHLSWCWLLSASLEYALLVLGWCQRMFRAKGGYS